MEKEKYKILPDKAVYDRFFNNGKDIVVLNNSVFEGVIDKDKLILGELIDDGKSYTLKALSEEEYKSAAEKYQYLLKLEKGDNE